MSAAEWEMLLGTCSSNCCVLSTRPSSQMFPFISRISDTCLWKLKPSLLELANCKDKCSKASASKRQKVQINLLFFWRSTQHNYCRGNSFSPSSLFKQCSSYVQHTLLTILRSFWYVLQFPSSHYGSISVTISAEGVGYNLQTLRNYYPAVF